VDTLPFGTRQNVYADGYEFAAHSVWPKDAVAAAERSRVVIGGPDCAQPYSAALLNVSAMSYGALSENAVLALSRAAKSGGFYVNTGEGGMSRFHLEGGGDLVWNIGTGVRLVGASPSFTPPRAAVAASTPRPLFKPACVRRSVPRCGGASRCVKWAASERLGPRRRRPSRSARPSG
jgi:hypothetical protein